MSRQWTCQEINLRNLSILFILLFVSLQQFYGYAAGVTPKETFTLTPSKGKYYYPENIILRKGEEYIVINETEENYIIKYEVLKGISEKIYVPKDKVVYIEETQSELLERRKQEAIERFEKEQEVKGLVKVNKFWVTRGNHKLWLKYINFINLRKEIISLENTDKKIQNDLFENYKYIIELNDSYISLQKQSNSIAQWLKESRITEWSPEHEINLYNSKVGEYNTINNKMSKILMEEEYLKISCEKKAKEILLNEERGQIRKSKYIQDISQFETLVVHKLNNSQSDQKEFLNIIAENIHLFCKELILGEANVDVEGGAIFVNATLNNKLDIKFTVDTGASYVCISKDIATKLGINVSMLKTKIPFSLADGSVIDAPIANVSSISIGTLRKNNIQVAILNDSPGFCPLLGMSFLKYFNWHVKGKKIILKTLEFNDINT